MIVDTSYQRTILTQSVYACCCRAAIHRWREPLRYFAFEITKMIAIPVQDPNRIFVSGIQRFARQLKRITWSQSVDVPLPVPKACANHSKCESRLGFLVGILLNNLSRHHWADILSRTAFGFVDRFRNACSKCCNRR